MIPGTLPEFDHLRMHLDHENVYVRTSVAAALAEAMELWPQTTSRTIKTLCELYREKVSHRNPTRALLMPSIGEGTGPRI